MSNVSELVGRVMTDVNISRAGKDEIVFTCDDGRRFKMYHDYECCEHVYIDDIVGDIQDLVGTPILVAEETSNSDKPRVAEDGYVDESFTWTFYKFRTIKGSVDIRWYGSSVGCYSEAVDFHEMDSSGRVCHT